MFTKVKDFVQKFPIAWTVIIGFFLRLYGLTASSIWHDEGYTMWLLRYDFGEILARTARDVHPPMYYLISKAWVTFFGTSEFAIRFLSLLFSVGIIFLTYKIIESIWDRKSAFWASMLLAFSPFMIRFGQEARMYGVVAFFTTLAAYYFIKAYKDKKNANLNLILFTISMSIAMYTQYYAFFVIVSLWVIYAIITPEFWKFQWIKAIKESKGVFSWKWWLANLALLVMYLPWFPIAYKQVTRVGGSYWIKPEWITERTVPNNVLQFISYDHLDKLFRWGILGPIFYWAIVIFLIGVGLFLLKNREKWKVVASLYVFGYLPMLLVFTLSKLKTPVYQDRYFPFSAIALFAIWGIVIGTIRSDLVRRAVGFMAVTILVSGIYIMQTNANHQMKALSEVVKDNMSSEDKVYSGELYTFLDGAYYFGDKNIKLISSPVDGFGESSLFYDKQDEYIVSKTELNTLYPNRVWVLGKTGDKDYFKESNWLGWSAKTYFEEEGKNNGLKAVLFTRQ